MRRDAETKDATLLFCRCARTRAMPEDVKQTVYDGLRRAGVAFEAVEDLCGLAARRDPWLKEFGRREGVRIVACYPRAVQWLFHAGEAPLPEDAEFFNMRKEEAADILATLMSRREGGPGDAAQRRDGEDGWVPWFPVIDYDRCQGCMQCKKFCLFGVFGEGPDERPVVKNPKNCKTNCPACARICPETAIIFPKHESSPINGSDDKAAAPGGASRVDLEALLKGDLYAMLRSRGHEAGSLMDAARKLAEEERRKCACSLGKEDPPPEAANIMKSLCECDCDCEPESGCRPDGEEEGPCCG